MSIFWLDALKNRHRKKYARKKERKNTKFKAKNEAEKIDNKTNFNSGTSERKCLSLLVIKKNCAVFIFFLLLGII